MRTIEEIKYDMRTTGEIIDDRSLNRIPFTAYTHKYKELKCELYEAITSGIPLDRLAAICQAEREQRAVVLPCKVGGIVYNRKGEKYFVTGISIADDIVISAAKDRDNSIWTGIQFEPFDIGVTVFLTPEAARAALDGGAK